MRRIVATAMLGLALLTWAAPGHAHFAQSLVQTHAGSSADAPDSGPYYGSGVFNKHEGLGQTSTSIQQSFEDDQLFGGQPIREEEASASADLSTSQVRAYIRGVQRVNSVPGGTITVAGGFVSDRATLQRGSGPPFGQRNGDVVTFTLDVSGSFFTNATPGANFNGSVIGLVIAKPGGITPLLAFDSPDYYCQVFWGIGSDAQVRYTRNGSIVELPLKAKLTSLPATLTASCVPGPEYEWAVFIRPSYVGVSISDWEFAFDNTVDVSVHVPADVTMTSDSGFVPPTGPAADPLPLDHFLTYTTKATKGSICATDSAANVGKACQVEEDCGGVSDGENETAFCVPNKFPANVRVALTDMIDTDPKLFDVKKPLSLCVPADKRGEGIVDADTHLRGYAIAQTAKRCAAGSPQNAGGACTQEASCGGTRETSFCAAQPKFVKQTAINVVNQFHATPIVLDAIKPDRLLIPTSKGVTDPEPPPDPTGVDHYRCYTVAVPRTAPKFTPIPGVAVDDQFTNGAKLFDLKKPTRLCVPTSKNAEGVVNPLKSLLCYQAAPTKGQPKLVPAKGLFLRNQLGAEQADTGKEEEFCVPSDAGVEPGPGT